MRRGETPWNDGSELLVIECLADLLAEPVSDPIASVSDPVLTKAASHIVTARMSARGCERHSHEEIRDGSND